MVSAPAFWLAVDPARALRFAGTVWSLLSAHTSLYISPQLTYINALGQLHDHVALLFQLMPQQETSSGAAATASLWASQCNRCTYTRCPLAKCVLEVLVLLDQGCVGSPQVGDEGRILLDASFAAGTPETATGLRKPMAHASESARARYIPGLLCIALAQLEVYLLQCPSAAESREGRRGRRGMSASTLIHKTRTQRTLVGTFAPGLQPVSLKPHAPSETGRHAVERCAKAMSTVPRERCSAVVDT